MKTTSKFIDSLMRSYIYIYIYINKFKSHTKYFISSLQNLQADFCHHLPSILGIQKGVALRLRRIGSNDEEYNNKSKE